MQNQSRENRQKKLKQYCSKVLLMPAGSTDRDMDQLISSLLIPLHDRLEKWRKEKNGGEKKKIRLAAAKKTIDKLKNNQN